jgi:probable O-glycosylation ligase (exosortase A-associated)
VSPRRFSRTTRARVRVAPNPYAAVAGASGWPQAGALEATPRSPLVGVQWTLTLAGFLLYLFVITSYRLPIGDVAIGAALVGVLLQPGGIRIPSLLGWLGAFSVWAAITATQTEYPHLVQPQLETLVKLCLIVFVASNAMQTRAQTRLFMVFFLGCFALFPLRGAMFNFFFYGNDMGGRAIWNQLYGNPNDLGAIALLQLSMAVTLLESEPRGWVRWSALLGVILVPMLILMTQSRGVFIGLLVFVALTLAGHHRRLRIIVRLSVIAAVLAAIAPAGVWERLGTLKHATSTETLDQVDGEGGSARQRYEIWRVGFAIIRDHPFTGVGVGAYEANHERYALEPEFNPTARGPRDAHSLYFNVLAETGYPGLLIYAGMLVALFVAAERTRRRCKGVLDASARQLLVLEAGLVAFLAAAVFGSLPYLPHFLLHLVLMNAMVVLALADLKRMSGQPAASAFPSALARGMAGAWLRPPKRGRA